MPPRQRKTAKITSVPAAHADQPEDGEVDNQTVVKRRALTTTLGKVFKESERKLQEDGAKLLTVCVTHKHKHRTFWSNIQLALVVALWAAIFGAPVYASVRLHDFFFGSWEHHAETAIPLCGPDIFGHAVVADNSSTLAASDLSSLVVVYDAAVHGPWTGAMPQVWCGLLPEAYEDYWPIVVQMMIFTVYQSTGSTVQLAWQGVVGTGWACVNARLMSLVFPSGAKTHECTAEEARHSACEAGSSVRDGQYVEAVAWADALGVLLLFLVSRSEEGTIKFGMSWHIYFMMNFMNPSIGVIRGPVRPTGFIDPDAETTVVFATVVVGAILAVVATLLPFPLLNIRNVYHDASNAVRDVGRIWKDAIYYFCGQGSSVKRLQVVARIKLFNKTVSRIKGNLDSSWWETFNMGRYGMVRECYGLFDGAVGGSDARNAVHTMGASLTGVNFGEEHSMFSRTMETALEGLWLETIKLLQLCAASCRDGIITEAELQNIDKQLESTAEAQEELVSQYKKVRPSALMANECTFIFALSFWAKQMSGLAELIKGKQQRPRCCSGLGSAVGAALQHMSSVASLPRILEREHLGFAFRNFVGIALCFVIGYYCEGTVFHRYDSGMASTLSLLISHFHGSSARNKLQRLLGVIIGTFIPMMILATLSYLGCHNEMRFYGQFAAISMYLFFFNYMYYASASWSLFGCLASGMGCIPLLTPCRDVATITDGFGNAYAQLGRVIIAMGIQGLVDELLRGKSAREAAVERVRDVRTALTRGYSAFFSGDMPGLQEAIAAATTALDAASALVSEVHPSAQVFPGPHMDFNADAFGEALETLRLIVSDMSTLHSAARGGGGGSDVAVLEALHGLSAMKLVREDVLKAVGGTTSLLLAVLEHTTEDEIRHGRLREVEHDIHLGKMNGMPELFAELQAKDWHGGRPGCLADDLRIRLTVAVRALESAAEHLAEVDCLCVKADCM